MFPRVTEAWHLTEYKIAVKFNDGHQVEVDLKAELYGEVFERLKDLQLFKAFRVNTDTHTIEWPNGADFAADFLYRGTLESFFPAAGFHFEAG